MHGEVVRIRNYSRAVAVDTQVPYSMRRENFDMEHLGSWLWGLVIVAEITAILAQVLR